MDLSKVQLETERLRLVPVSDDHILWPCAKENTSSCKVAESLGGKIHQEYVKKTDSGKTWPYVDYWITKSHGR